MKPINYEAITNAARLRAGNADNFLDTLRTVPAHWTALCDAAAALSDVWTTYQAMDAETRDIVADAVGIGAEPLRSALFAFETPAKPPSAMLLKLLGVLYPEPSADEPAEINDELEDSK